MRMIWFRKSWNDDKENDSDTSSSSSNKVHSSILIYSHVNDYETKNVFMRAIQNIFLRNTVARLL